MFTTAEDFDFNQSSKYSNDNLFWDTFSMLSQATMFKYHRYAYGHVFFMLWCSVVWLLSDASCALQYPGQLVFRVAPWCVDIMGLGKNWWTFKGWRFTWGLEIEVEACSIFIHFHAWPYIIVILLSFCRIHKMSIKKQQRMQKVIRVCSDCCFSYHVLSQFIQFHVSSW